MKEYLVIYEILIPQIFWVQVATTIMSLQAAGDASQFWPIGMVLRSSPELVRELQNHVKQTTAPYKYPRIIEFADALPKTISGKIRRIEIRARDEKS